jgi:hypothetical protein
MRESPKKNQMKAREMFLEMHRPKIVSDYRTPSGNIHFDPTITELMINDVFIGEVMAEQLHEGAEVQRISKMRASNKQRLLDAYDLPLDDYIEKWEIHLDYESLIMDKLIDLQRVPVKLLTVTSGRTFFHQQAMYSLMHQGFQQAQKEPNHEQSQWFSQWDNRWYCKHGATRYRLIDILQQYTPEWIDDFAEMNTPKTDSLSETYGKMEKMHRTKMLCAGLSKFRLKAYSEHRPTEAHYFRFVAEAMEFNEELRLMRSKSVFDFIQGCQKAEKVPYEEFIRILNDRQQRFVDQYGGEIGGKIEG